MFVDFDDFDYHVLPDPLEIVEGEPIFDDLGLEPIHDDDYDFFSNF